LKGARRKQTNFHMNPKLDADFTEPKFTREKSEQYQKRMDKGTK
jgi:hypothetical protein